MVALAHPRFYLRMAYLIPHRIFLQMNEVSTLKLGIGHDRTVSLVVVGVVDRIVVFVQ